MRACTRSRWWRISTPRPSGLCTPGCWAPTPTSRPRLSVLWAHVVPDDFHARHQARSRRYLYRILDRPHATGARAPARLLDPPRARCRAHARSGAGAARPPRLLRLPRVRMPVADARAQAHRASSVERDGDLRRHPACRPTPSCITWSATSRAALILVGRGERPVGVAVRRSCRAATAARPGPRRRRKGCISSGPSTRPGSACLRVHCAGRVQECRT